MNQLRNKIKKYFKFLSSFIGSIFFGIFLFYSFFMNTSCITNLFTEFSLKVQTLNLFNQTYSPNYNKLNFSFYNNWILRRERLSVIDEELSHTKPDIVFFQEALFKNLSDSDTKILSSNSLSKYNFLDATTKQYSGYKELLSTATAPKIVLNNFQHYALSKDSHISVGIYSYQSDNLALFNVKLSDVSQDVFMNKFIEIYNTIIQNKTVCKHRIIVGGDFGDNLAKDFVDRISSSTYLKTPITPPSKKDTPMLNSNSLYNIVIKYPREENYVQDYIFVPKSSSITKHSIVFNQIVDNQLKHSKLKKLTPSLRYGWEIDLRLASCK